MEKHPLGFMERQKLLAWMCGLVGQAVVLQPPGFASLEGHLSTAWAFQADFLAIKESLEPFLTSGSHPQTSRPHLSGHGW